MSNAPQCPWCDHASRVWLRVGSDWRRGREASEHQLYWCDACAYGQLHPRPTPAAVAAAYDLSEYYTHQSPGSPTDPSTRPESVFNRLRVHLAWRFDRGVELTDDWFARYVRREPGRVCDLGCGSGDLLARLARLGHEVQGVEPDEAARRVAMDKGIPVSSGTAEELPEALPRGAFDVVIMAHSLEHCLDARRALANARSLLASGGMMVVETPNNACRGLSYSGVAWHWLDVPRHLNFFTAHSLTLACGDVGCQVLRVDHCGYVRQFQGEWIAAEQQIHDRLAARGKLSVPRNSTSRAWRLLGRTAFASPARKYDSVRIVVRRES